MTKVCSVMLKWFCYRCSTDVLLFSPIQMHEPCLLLGGGRVFQSFKIALIRANGPSCFMAPLAFKILCFGASLQIAVQIVQRVKYKTNKLTLLVYWSIGPY